LANLHCVWAATRRHPAAQVTLEPDPIDREHRPFKGTKTPL